MRQKFKKLLDYCSATSNVLVALDVKCRKKFNIFRLRSKSAATHFQVSLAQYRNTVNIFRLRVRNAAMFLVKFATMFQSRLRSNSAPRSQEKTAFR